MTCVRSAPARHCRPLNAYSSRACPYRTESHQDGPSAGAGVPGADAKPLALTIAKQASPETLSTQAAGLKPGEYSIRWQVLASDGHITRGVVPFTVRAS